MSVGLVAVAIATSIGTSVGLTAGYAGGGIDNLLMRLTEFVQTFPLFFAVVILVALVGPNVFNVMAVIGQPVPEQSELVRIVFSLASVCLSTTTIQPANPAMASVHQKVGTATMARLRE